MNRRERRAARAIERQRDGISPVADIVSLQAAAAAAAEASPAGKFNNAGHVLASQGRAEEACAQFERAIAVDPDFALAHFNLGILHHGQGRLDAAIDCYLRVIELKPDHMDAHNNLCAVLLARGQFAAVAAHCEAILEIRPNQASIYGKLAIAHIRRGDAARALDVLTRALQAAPSQENQFLFVMCLENLQTTPNTPEMRELIVRAMTEPWARPAQLTGHCLNLIKSDPVIAGCIERAAAAWPQRLPGARLYGASGLAAMARDPALRALLENARNADIAIERFLTAARAALLEAAERGEDPGDDVLAFYCALARQCFINEYIFACDAGEYARFERLRDSLSAALQFDSKTPAIWTVAVAAYQPLHQMTGGAALLAQTWPQPLEDLLTQQLRNPIEELRLRDAIPALTPIDDDVSLLVQQQYEETPLPAMGEGGDRRRTRPASTRGCAARFPLRRFPQSRETFSPTCWWRAAAPASNWSTWCSDAAGASVLAIDLSLASLGYARAAAREARHPPYRIRPGRYPEARHARARVRHHRLRRSAASSRRSAGRLARAAFALAAERGDAGRALQRAGAPACRGRAWFRGRARLKAGADDIRAFRQEVLALPDDHRVKKLTRSLDFFSMGDCRDLVFHVQEHRFTVPQIAAFLAEAGLQFLGFEVPPRIQAYMTPASRPIRRAPICGTGMRSSARCRPRSARCTNSGCRSAARAGVPRGHVCCPQHFPHRMAALPFDGLAECPRSHYVRSHPAPRRSPSARSRANERPVRQEREARPAPTAA